MNGRWWLPVLSVAVLIGAWFYFRPTAEVPEGDPAGDVAAAAASNTGGAADEPSPFSTVDTPADATTTTDATPVAATDEAVTDVADNSDAASDLPPVDLYALGRTPLSDDEIRNLVARMRADPDLLQAVLNELRQTTDPERLARLAQLLGDVGGPEVTAAAGELIYSGNPAARTAGLRLLQSVQPGNAEAREIVAGILSTEIEPEVLVESLTAIAVPGAVEPEARESMAEQVSILASTHPDASVRRTSIDVLSRWTEDPRHTPILLNALHDEDDAVRETAAFALVGHEDASDEVVFELFNTVENTQENERTRRGALLALKRMDRLTESERDRVNEWQVVLDRK